MQKGKTILNGVTGNPKKDLPELSQSDYESLYCRNAKSGGNKTVICGYNDAVNQAEDLHFREDAYDRDASLSTSDSPRNPERRIVGVMFSLSKDNKGEIFPICLGENLIGCDPKCDICLREGTVSAEHARLNVWESFDDDADYRMSITDASSYYGTKVGDNDVLYGAVNIVDDDIVSVGLHYKLLVRFFNTKRRYLMADDGFIALPDLDAAREIEQYDTIGADFYKPNKKENDNRTVLYESGKTKG